LQPKRTKDGRLRSDVARSAIAKGKTGERALTDILTKISGVPFIRIPNSGARVGLTNRDRIHQFTEHQVESMLGDIFPPHELRYHMIIESKNYASLAFKKLSQGKLPALLEEWISEILYDIESYLIFKERYKRKIREPLGFLGFKITKQGTWIAYSKTYFEKLCLDKFNPTYTVLYRNISPRLEQIGYGMEWYIEDFKTFVINNKINMFELSPDAQDEKAI